MSVEFETDLNTLRETGQMDTAGKYCTYCRERKPDCRPCAVINRSFIPALCDECYCALRSAGRHDVERDREVFHP